MVEPVKLSTLYDPQGKWTGLGPEPTDVSAPEGQEAYFTPGQQIQAPHSGMARAGMQWADKVRYGYDPWTGKYPGEGTYKPGTVSYRDIITPAPIQQVQNLIPGTTPPVVNQQTLQQQAQEKANAQLMANLFPIFNQPTVAPTTPAVAPTTPAVAPQPTMAQPTMAQPTPTGAATDPGDAERYRQGIFGARPVDQYALDPLNPFFYLPGQNKPNITGTPPIDNMPGLGNMPYEDQSGNIKLPLTPEQHIDLGHNQRNSLNPGDPGFRPGPFGTYDLDPNDPMAFEPGSYQPYFYISDPNRPNEQIMIAKELYPDPSTGAQQALADIAAGTKDFRYGPFGAPREGGPGTPIISDWWDGTKYAEGGEVLNRPMFANGGPVNPPVNPQEAMAPDVLAASSTGEPEVKESDIDAMSSPEYTDKEVEVYQTIQDKMENATGFEDIIDVIRGDEKSMKERRAELAEVVGPGDAKKTPESSLTIAQFGLQKIEEFNEGMAKGETAPEGIETLPPGAEALAADQGALMGGEQMPQIPEMMQPPPQMAAGGGMIRGYAYGGIINALPHYEHGGYHGSGLTRLGEEKLYQETMGLDPLYTGQVPGYIKGSYYQQMLKKEKQKLQGLNRHGVPIRGVDAEVPYVKKPGRFFTTDYTAKMKDWEEQQETLDKIAKENLEQLRIKREKELPEHLKEKVTTKKSKLTTEDKTAVDKMSSEMGITKKQDLDSIRQNVESLFGDAETQTEAIQELAKGNMEIMQKFAGPNKDENTFQLGMLLMKMGLDIGTSKEQNLLTNIMESGKGLTQGLIVMGAQAASDRKELGRTATLLAIRQFEDTKTPNMRDLDTLLRSNVPWDVALERVFPSATDSVYNDSMKKMIGEMFLPEWRRISSKDEYKDDPQGAMNEFMDKFGRKLSLMDSMLSNSLRGFNTKGGGRRDMVTTDYGVEDAPLVLQQRFGDDYTGLSEEEASIKREKDYKSLPRYKTEKEVIEAAKKENWEKDEPFLYGNEYKVRFYNPS